MAEQNATPPDASAPAGAAAPRPAPAPDLQERMQGLQGWMAEIERKQARMTYFGGAAAILALATAAVALVIAITGQQSTQDDVDELRRDVSGLQQSVKTATENQLRGVSESLGSIDERIEALKSAQQRDAATLRTLQNQVNSLQTAPPAGNRNAPGGGATTNGGGRSGDDANP